MTVKKETKKNGRILAGWKMKDFMYVGREDRSFHYVYVDGVKILLDHKVIYKDGDSMYDYLYKNKQYRDKYFIPVYKISQSNQLSDKK